MNLPPIHNGDYTFHILTKEQESTSLTKKPTRTIAKSEIEKYYHLTKEEAAQHFGISLSYFRKIYMKHGITAWPFRRMKAINSYIDFLKPYESHEIALNYIKILEEKRFSKEKIQTDTILREIENIIISIDPEAIIQSKSSININREASHKNRPILANLASAIKENTPGSTTILVRNISYIEPKSRIGIEKVNTQLKNNHSPTSVNLDRFNSFMHNLKINNANRAQMQFVHSSEKNKSQDLMPCSINDSSLKNSIDESSRRPLFQFDSFMHNLKINNASRAQIQFVHSSEKNKSQDLMPCSTNDSPLKNSVDESSRRPLSQFDSFMHNLKINNANRTQNK